MWLKMNIDGIILELNIRGYQPSDHDNWDSKWCDVGYRFSSNDWLNYGKDHDEILLSCEVEYLEKILGDLLSGNIKDERSMGCIEPDFQFVFSPAREAYGVEDVYLEWQVYFWDDGLTANYLSLTLDCNEIELLRNYLLLITGKLGLNSSVIQEMVSTGTLYS